jgi:hypothetical protein
MVQESKVQAAQKKLDEASGAADSRAIKEFQERLDGEKLKLTKVQADADKIKELKASTAANSTAEAVAKEFQDILAEYLDTLHGSTVTDINIYRHASHLSFPGSLLCRIFAEITFNGYESRRLFSGC